MANTKISALPANNNPTGSEELVYALNNANGKMTLSTMKTFANTWQQAELVSGVNIKTINNTSILWSGNIDVSWGGGWGGFEPTELWGDANIWELSEWAYITTYDLYYTSGNKIPRMSMTSSTYKQMLFVVEESTWEKWYFVYNVWHKGTSYTWRAAYWYSISSSVGECDILWAWDKILVWYDQTYTWPLDQIEWSTFTHIISNFANNTRSLRVDSLYPWMTYTIYVSSYDSWESATITVWAGVTNPLNIALPSACTKPFVITLLATSASTAIVTSCTIQS